MSSESSPITPSSSHSSGSRGLGRPTLPSLNEVLPDYVSRTSTGGIQSSSRLRHSQQSPSSSLSHSHPYHSQSAHAQEDARSNSSHGSRSSGSPSPPRSGSPYARRQYRPLMEERSQHLMAQPSSDPSHAFAVHKLDPRQGQMHTLQTNVKNPVHLHRPLEVQQQEKPKPHQCSLCGAAFERPSAVQIHMRTHTHEKPFLCTYCGKSYPSSTNLNRHIRQVHGLETSNPGDTRK